MDGGTSMTSWGQQLWPFLFAGKLMPAMAYRGVCGVGVGRQRLPLHLGRLPGEPSSAVSSGTATAQRVVAALGHEKDRTIFTYPVLFSSSLFGAFPTPTAGVGGDTGSFKSPIGVTSSLATKRRALGHCSKSWVPSSRKGKDQSSDEIPSLPFPSKVCSLDVFLQHLQVQP